MSDRLIDQNYPDTFVCELSRIDKLGSNRRLIFTVPSADGDGYKTIVRKMIVPADYMVTLAWMIAGDGRSPTLPPICLTRWISAALRINANPARVPSSARAFAWTRKTLSSHGLP